VTDRRPLRVLHLMAAPFPSLQGSQVFVGGMIRALAARGHRPSLLCYGHGDPALEGEEQPFEIQRVRRVPGYGRMRAGPDVVKPALDLALAVKACELARGVDLVHAHNYEAPLAAYLARRLRGVPVVYHAHNTMEEELPSYFGSRTLSGVGRGLGWLLDHSIPRRAELALAISEHGRHQLRRLGCADVRLLWPAVELTELEGARPERARERHGLSGRPWVVYAGNVDRYQDLELLFSAMARLPQAGLLLVTANPLDGLAARCDAFGIHPARRRLVRVQSWEESRDLIAAGSVAALPRTICSGFAIKLLNYLGLGLPVVASAGAAAPIEGVVASHDRSPEGMAAALGYLLAHPEQRRGLGELGQAAVRRGWSWSARVLELEALYRELLERGPDAQVVSV
jgi:starch synthase